MLISVRGNLKLLFNGSSFSVGDEDADQLLKTLIALRDLTQLGIAISARKQK